MVLYFKCDKCKTKFIDYFGEYAHEDTKECYINGPYECTECGIFKTMEKDYISN